MAKSKAKKKPPHHHNDIHGIAIEIAFQAVRSGQYQEMEAPDLAQYCLDVASSIIRAEDVDD